MAQSKPDWDALQQGLAGDVVLPGSDEYEWARRPFIARFDEIGPQAIARCSAPEDVAEVIAFARRYGIDRATRSGGHCLAGYSSTRGILIDVTPMRSVVVADGVAKGRCRHAHRRALRAAQRARSGDSDGHLSVGRYSRTRPRWRPRHPRARARANARSSARGAGRPRRRADCGVRRASSP